MQAWDELCKTQEQSLGKETVDRWLRTLKVLHFDACNLYLEAKDSFQALWFEEHIRPIARSQFRNNNNKLIRVHLSVTETHSDPLDPKKSAFSHSKKLNGPFSISFDPVEEEACFDTFFPFQGNLLPFKLLTSMSKWSPNGELDSQHEFDLASFNPVYLYGETGCGKTHLAMAFANELKKNGHQVAYARAETFTEHVISAIRLGQMRAFRKAYRNIDVLILDNVQILSRKMATQEELFHTFNTLHNQGKQIILVADCSPSELQSIEPRLVSRFEWGISAHIAPLPASELKLLLRQKADFLKLSIQDDVFDFLIDRFKANAKSLIKAFEALQLRLHLSAKNQQIEINLTNVDVLLKDLLAKEKQASLTPEKIIQAVADHYGIRPEDILGKSQSRDCATPRQVAMHLCRLKLKLPFMKIGSIFSRDHSTVMTSVKQIQKHLTKRDSELTQILNSIQKDLQKKI